MLSTVFSLLVVVVALVPPAIAQRIVDHVFVPSVKEGNFSSRTTLLVSLIAVLVVAAVLRAGLIFLRNNLVEVYSQRAQSDLKQRLYDQIQAQSFGFFHNTRTGELMARMTNDVEMVRGLLSNGLLQGASGILFFIGAAHPAGFAELAARTDLRGCLAVALHHGAQAAHGHEAHHHRGARAILAR